MKEVGDTKLQVQTRLSEVIGPESKFYNMGINMYKTKTTSILTSRMPILNIPSHFSQSILNRVEPAYLLYILLL